MTLIERIAVNGWGIDVQYLKDSSAVIRVGFINESCIKLRDFCIDGAGTVQGLHDLCSLYDDFCEVTGIRNDMVASVSVVCFCSGHDNECCNYTGCMENRRVHT